MKLTAEQIQEIRDNWEDWRQFEGAIQGGTGSGLTNCYSYEDGHREFNEWLVDGFTNLLDQIAQLEAEVAELKEELNKARLERNKQEANKNYYKAKLKEAELWIPVEEMPKEQSDIEYLLRLKGGYAVGHYDGRRWFRYCTRGVEYPIEKSYYHSVTHWRPLPKPPEAKGE